MWFKLKFFFFIVYFSSVTETKNDNQFLKCQQNAKKAIPFWAFYETIEWIYKILLNTIYHLVTSTKLQILFLQQFFLNVI